MYKGEYRYRYKFGFGIKFKRERRIKKVPFLSGPDFSSQQVMNSGSDGCASAWIHVCPDEFVKAFEVGFGKQKRYEFQHIIPQHAIEICGAGIFASFRSSREPLCRRRTSS